jgi:hypothetical protein
VENHDDAVAAGVDIELEDPGAVVHGALEGDEGILRRQPRRAAMTEDPRAGSREVVVAGHDAVRNRRGAQAVNPAELSAPR